MTRLAFLLAALLVAGCQYATPRSESQRAEVPVRPSQQVAAVTAGALSGAPHLVGGLAAWQVVRESRPVPEEQRYGAPSLTPEVLAGGTTYSGKLAWADPKYGSRYLALREPRGTLVELCAASGCVQRRSTDFGPVLSLWRAGRIADVSAADFLEICGVPLSFGLCPGSVQVLERPRIELPATDLEGP